MSLQALHKYASLGFPFGIPQELNIDTVLQMSQSVNTSLLPKTKVTCSSYCFCEIIDACKTLATIRIAAQFVQMTFGNFNWWYSACCRFNQLILPVQQNKCSSLKKRIWTSFPTSQFLFNEPKNSYVVHLFRSGMGIFDCFCTGNRFFFVVSFSSQGRFIYCSFTWPICSHLKIKHRKM